VAVQVDDVCPCEEALWCLQDWKMGDGNSGRLYDTNWVIVRVDVTRITGIAAYQEYHVPRECPRVEYRYNVGHWRFRWKPRRLTAPASMSSFASTTASR
jgi:hypothetical protein